MKYRSTSARSRKYSVCVDTESHSDDTRHINLLPAQHCGRCLRIAASARKRQLGRDQGLCPEDRRHPALCVSLRFNCTASKQADLLGAGGSLLLHKLDRDSEVLEMGHHLGDGGRGDESNPVDLLGTAHNDELRDTPGVSVSLVGERNNGVLHGRAQMCQEGRVSAYFAVPRVDIVPEHEVEHLPKDNEPSRADMHASSTSCKGVSITLAPVSRLSSLTTGSGPRATLRNWHGRRQHQTSTVTEHTDLAPLDGSGSGSDVTNTCRALPTDTTATTTHALRLSLIHC